MIEAPKYFTLKELTTTSTIYKNFPESWELISNLLLLGSYLDRIRTAFGKPIAVNSGFRSAMVNKAVGGSPTSSHLKGLAADIRPIRGQLGELVATLRELLREDRLMLFDQIIIYDTFVHVGFAKSNPRRQIWDNGEKEK